MHADPGTEGVASAELNRKVTFRSSTEACKFMWMCVMESLFFLWARAWPSVARIITQTAAPPGLIDTQ